MKKIVYTALALALLTGCYYDNKEELYPNTFGNNTACDTTNLTYNNGIKALINGNCASAGCHVPGATSPDLSTYTGVVSNITRVKIRAIDQKSMPASAPLPLCELSKLTAGINAGTPQ